MELTWTNNQKKVMLTQTNVIERLIKEHEITNQVLTKSLPLQLEPHEIGETKLQPTETTKYQLLVGSLLYINRFTRPEITVHVNLLGSRTSDASHKNLQTALQLLRYLALTKTEGIPLTQSAVGKIIAYADASYGGEGAR